jgi:hypothetical protein
LPKDGPYFAAHEIGLDSLWQQHPEADGRGVTAGILDSGVELLHPALEQARDASGQLIPKIADQVSFGTPEDDKNWVRLGEPIQTQDGIFHAAGRIWTAPEEGLYRFGIYRSKLVLGPEGNSHAKKLQLAVGVLLDEKNNRVWVDTNGDGSFKDQRALSDYASSHEIDWFGSKQGDDDNRIPFGVKVDSTRPAVFVTIVDGGTTGNHGTEIAGSLAANRLTGGLYDGAAPGAQLIDARDSRLMQLPAILQLAAKGNVSVISLSAGFARAGYEGPREGIEDFKRHLAERMVAVYDKAMTCVCVAYGLISVDDYVSGEMLRRNRQTSGPYVEAFHGFYDASRSWGLVNNVFAPSGQLNTESRYMPEGIIFADGKRHTLADDRVDSPAPPGYWIGANESPTVPVVSGVLADIISEAKREHVRFTTPRLNQAIFASARIIPDIPVYQQGYGLIQAAAAWNQLAKMAKADDPANAALTSFTVSQVENNQEKEIDGYYHEVTKLEGTVDGEIWLTRRGGYAGTRAYSFALRGNDGTYKLLTTKAALIQDKPAKILFRAKVTSGFHVAFIELIDRKSGAVMQLIPLSLKIPDVPKIVAAGVERYEATMAPRRADTRLIYFENDVQAVHYIVQIPYERDDDDAYGPGIQCGRKKPDGEPIDIVNHVGPLVTCDSLTANTGAGFQYVGWENRSFHAEYETPYDPPAPNVPITGTVTVTKYAIAITKTQQELSLTNQLAEIHGRVELFDAKFITSELHGQGNHAMAETEFQMPANLVQWRAQVTGVIAGADADAYLFDCPRNNGCYVVSQEKITNKGALLVVDKPEAGAWKIVIRSREQVTGNSTFKFAEAQLTPTQTGVTSTDARYSSGEGWTVPLPSTTQYAAFHIAGTPGVEREKNGLLIAMTALERDTP